MIFYEITNPVKDQADYYDSKASKNKKKALLFLGIGLSMLGIGFWYTTMVLYISAFLIILGIGELMSYELLKNKSLTYFYGYLGENKLKDFLLKNLSNEYTAYFGVPIPKLGDIDCLLVGPNGIFVIEAKNYKGNLFFKKGHLYRTKITNRGKRYTEVLYKPKTQVEKGIEFIKNIIKKQVPIRGIIVFTNKKAIAKFPKTFRLSKTPWIGACKIDDLIKIIFELPENLSSEELLEINETIKEKFLK